MLVWITALLIADASVEALANTAVAHNDGMPLDFAHPGRLPIHRQLSHSATKNNMNLALLVPVLVGSEEGVVSVNLQVDTGSSDVSFLPPS